MNARICLAASLLLIGVAAHPREIGNLADIQRETRIVGDVMKSALREQLSSEARVASVSAEYLAKQGVLITISLNSPWLNLTESGGTSIAINGNISIPEIPAMVENILNDLQVNVAPYEPEALEDLRDLRGAQRELRLEGREIRAKLRQKRREMIRAEGGEDHADAIAELEQQLADVDVQYQNLSDDIEKQYQRLRDYRAEIAPQATEADTPKVGKVVAQVACDYGATLRSLSSENYLTFIVRRGKSARYYAFKMDHIYACNNRDMRPERLLELAYQYTSQSAS